MNISTNGVIKLYDWPKFKIIPYHEELGSKHVILCTNIVSVYIRLPSDNNPCQNSGSVSSVSSRLVSRLLYNSVDENHKSDIYKLEPEVSVITFSDNY